MCFILLPAVMGIAKQTNKTHSLHLVLLCMYLSVITICAEIHSLLGPSVTGRFIQGYFIILNYIHQSRYKMMTSQRDPVTVNGPLFLQC